MNWQYKQSTGQLYLVNDSGNAALFGTGWAGHSEGRNNPAMQNVKGVGPLPRGWYTIEKAYDHPHLGPITMDLTPDKTNQMFGRDLFRMHGAAAIHPEMSSDGCIIQYHSVRELVANSATRRLEVVA